MSPRRSAAHAAQTREAILERAVTVASTEGLEGLTIGRLATDLALSKSGVIGHFGSKEELQLAVLETAVQTFRAEVWERAAAAEPGLARLRALCEAWLSYLECAVFPGGCFLTAAATEFDDREGRVREAVRRTLSVWLAAIEREAAVAAQAGDLEAGADPAQIAFELNALVMGANQALQLHDDPEGVERARRGMARALRARERGSR